MTQLHPPSEIATELIAFLNSDNDYNYPYTVRQHQLLTELVADYLKQGLVFTDEVMEQILTNDPESGEDYEWESLGEILDDIWNGVDENGAELPTREQPFHFDCTPYPVK